MLRGYETLMCRLFSTNHFPCRQWMSWSAELEHVCVFQLTKEAAHTTRRKPVNHLAARVNVIIITIKQVLYYTTITDNNNNN